MRADGRRGGSNSVAYCPHRYCSQPGTVLVQQYDSFATGAIQLAAEPSLKNCLFGTYRASATKISLPSTTSTKPATKRAVPNATNCGASSTTELRNYCRALARWPWGLRVPPSGGICPCANPQNKNFRATCEMRGGAALTTLPNVASLMFPSTEPLPSNWVWLKVLNVSKRNSRDLLSVNFVTL
jgi:hypothetical protein